MLLSLINHFPTFLLSSPISGNHCLTLNFYANNLLIFEVWVGSCHLMTDICHLAQQSLISFTLLKMTGFFLFMAGQYSLVYRNHISSIYSAKWWILYWFHTFAIDLLISFFFYQYYIVYFNISKKGLWMWPQRMINVWCDSYSNHLNLNIIWYICDWYTIIYHINMYSYYLSIKNKAKWKRGKVSLNINSKMLQISMQPWPLVVWGEKLH